MILQPLNPQENLMKPDYKRKIKNLRAGYFPSICRKISLIIIFIMISSFGRIYADEIYLKDGGTIQGKILRVTENNIEFDPDGDKPFLLYPRIGILKFINKDGYAVYVKDGKDEKTIRF